MGRFASTVAYYESARPPYGAAFFEAVALAAWPGSEASACSMSAPGRAFWRSALRPIAGRSSASIRSRGWSRPRARRPSARRRGEVRRGPVRGRCREARRIRHCQHRPRDPLARSRACPGGARPRSRPSWKSSGLRRIKRQRRAQPVARDLQRRARSLEGRSTVARSSQVFRRRLVHPDGNDPGRGDLCRSGRASGRTRAVDVDLLVGAARGRGSGDEERHARGARALRCRRNDRGHCRSASRGVRARQAPMKAANFSRKLRFARSTLIEMSSLAIRRSCATSSAV